ncbi:hypothetical protein PR202_gb17977 [Eleusine coracana subsp. coracana]|uniref:Uncharacterized protein n=1 Tax=Eleusine coracana subsp. coracana TaxID=191504 RepID=A0AAV5F4G6_ELECO|nr:hypothetical protein PR202_gb17977 [Eleusine coracana subsp. coracana]
MAMKKGGAAGLKQILKRCSSLGSAAAAAARRAAGPLRGVRGRAAAPVRGAHRAAGPAGVPVPAPPRRGGVRVRRRRRRRDPRAPLRGGRLPLPHLRTMRPRVRRRPVKG